MSSNESAFDFGIRLRELRKSSGYTQKEIARKLNVHENTISGYENNTQNPPIDKLKHLAILYNTTSDYILGLSNKPLLLNGLNQSQERIINNVVETLIKELKK